MRIHHPRAYARILLGGSIGAGESFFGSDWDSDDLTRLIRIFVRNRDLLLEIERGLGSLAAPFQKIFHLLHRNSIEGSRKNIHAHYDLGNDFFSQFL